MVEGRVDGEFIGLCRAKSLDTRSAVGKNKRKKDRPPHCRRPILFVFITNFFTLTPVRGSSGFFFLSHIVCVSSVLRHWKNGRRRVLGH